MRTASLNHGWNARRKRSMGHWVLQQRRSGNYAKGMKESFRGPSSGRSEPELLLGGHRTPTSPPLCPTAPGPATVFRDGLRASSKPSPRLISGQHPRFFRKRTDSGSLPAETCINRPSLLSLLGKGVRAQGRPRAPEEAIFFGRVPGSGRVLHPHHALSVGSGERQGRG